MDRKIKKLKVSRTTLRRLSAEEMNDANGGTSTVCTVSVIASCFVTEPACYPRPFGCQPSIKEWC